jgi:resuscitation-promoting factor RpfB
VSRPHHLEETEAHLRARADPRPGEYDVWRVVRQKLARISKYALKSKTLLIGSGAVAAAAVIGTTVGYASMGKHVTLNVDGKVEHVTSSADTVGDVLSAQGITLHKHDEVAPGVNQQVDDGTVIAVRYGKPLTLDVDGKTSTYWVNALSVRGALHEIDRSFDRASLSVGRGAGITRHGLRLVVETPKRLVVKVGGHHAVHRNLPVLTVAQALREMHVHLGKHDIVRPGLKHHLADGDRVVLTRVRILDRPTSSEAIPYATVTRYDSSMYRGHSAIVRNGRSGLRRVTYRVVLHNGHVVARRLISQHVVRGAVARIERVGTKSRPAPAPAPTTNYASGGTVWDELAQCESGGNWADNTGNGYYGGLQFSLSTWEAYGGTGLPSSASRDTQIAIATKVRDAAGGYSPWPACSASLGLPQ